MARAKTVQNLTESVMRGIEEGHYDSDLATIAKACYKRAQDLGQVAPPKADRKRGAPHPARADKNDNGAGSEKVRSGGRGFGRGRAPKRIEKTQKNTIKEPVKPGRGDGETITFNGTEYPRASFIGHFAYLGSDGVWVQIVGAGNRALKVLYPEGSGLGMEDRDGNPTDVGFIPLASVRGIFG